MKYLHHHVADRFVRIFTDHSPGEHSFQKGVAEMCLVKNLCIQSASYQLKSIPAGTSGTFSTNSTSGTSTIVQWEKDSEKILFPIYFITERVHLQTIVSAVHNNQQHVDDLALSQHNGSDRQRDTTQANMLISSVYLKNSRNLYFTMWRSMLITINWGLPALIMFDIIADVYTNV